MKLKMNFLVKFYSLSEQNYDSSGKTEHTFHVNHVREETMHWFLMNCIL